MKTVTAGVIAVHPPDALTGRPRLLSSLSDALSVRFEPLRGEGQSCDAVIAFRNEDERASDVPTLAAGRPILVVEAVADSEPEDVNLHAVGELDRRLHGIALRDRLAPPERISPGPGVRVVASAASGPVWTVAGTVTRLRSALPELDRERTLWSLLSQRSVAAVAVVQFIRHASAGRGWQPPPVRATFLFDDPNLRWRSYGFLSYRALVQEADRHGYHATIAMIPLDAGRPHPPTSQLFRTRPDRLSLVFHGNDHVGEELRHEHDVGAALSVAAQARRRMALFSRRSGVTVSPVMTPPHGLCSEAMTRALAAVGFDGLAGIHPLPWTEDRPARAPTAGWQPADFVGGCAVVPRIPLESTAASVAHRAFLGQPIVLYGHHQDVRGGLDPLADIARLVNDLGGVRWTSLGDIARTNAETRALHGRMIVRPFSRRLRIPAVSQCRSVTVDPPADLIDDGEMLGWSLGGGAVLAFGDEAPIATGELEIRLHGRSDVHPSSVPAPARRPWPRLRRVVTEGRDRALPLTASLGRVRG